ncbi:MAG: creatininase family protein [Thermodesulfobacteriota bacterium]
MPLFEFGRMTFEEVDRLPRDTTIVILPMGPLEAHGPHLPLSVDIRGAEALTELAAELLSEKGYTVAIAPAVPYTLSDVAMPFPGTVTLSRSTVIALVRDIAGSFSRHGFRKLVINCHHLERPNLAALGEASKGAAEFGISVLLSNAILESMGECGPLMKGEHPEWDFHAGEGETSFFLWKFPGEVRSMYKQLPANWSNIREKFAAGARDFKEAGGDRCYFGDPARADAKTGEALYRVQARFLANEIDAWAREVV